MADRIASAKGGIRLNKRAFRRRRQLSNELTTHLATSHERFR